MPCMRLFLQVVVQARSWMQMQCVLREGGKIDTSCWRSSGLRECTRYGLKSAQGRGLKLAGGLVVDDV